MKRFVRICCLWMAMLMAVACVAPVSAKALETTPVETQSVSVTEATTAATLPQETEPAEETVPVQTTEREVEQIPSIDSLPLPEDIDEYDEVPLYLQTDYPNNMYGSGTIANNGCSIACLAMVATYMTDHEYLPDELARYFGGVAENNIKRLEQGAETMQLAWKKLANFHKALEALKEGKVVIALMDRRSIFTESQHFIVLTGYNKNGLIMVNDPYAPNYEKWDLKRAFEEGFTEGDILRGFEGAWAFDKSAMPEEPFLYYEENLGGDPRFPEIQLTYEERQLLARVVWVESRGECEDGQQAVAEVALNRLASGKYGETLSNVIYGEGQFRSVPFLDDAEPYQAQYEAIERAIYGPYVLPEDVFHFATYRTNENVWGQIGGHIFCYEG